MSNLVEKGSDEAIDTLYGIMQHCPKTECPVIHLGTPGMYIREIFIPAGTLVISKIHKTEHPFVVSKGEVMVLSDNDGSQLIKAPYTGITRPGTRRVLSVITDTIWTTFHRSTLVKSGFNLLSDEAKLKIVAKIENRIIRKRTIKPLNMEEIG